MAPNHKAATQVQDKPMAKEVNSAPLLPEPLDSSNRPLTCSWVPSTVDDTVVNCDTNGKHDATSHNPLMAKLPVTPNLNHTETCASNANQHPGQLHNA